MLSELSRGERVAVRDGEEKHFCGDGAAVMQYDGVPQAGSLRHTFL